MIIAIDGPAAAGKGTLAKALGIKLNFDYMDTGIIFRDLAFRMIQKDLKETDITAIIGMVDEIDFSSSDRNELRSPEVAQMASVIASIDEVRQATLSLQRRFAQNPPGAKGAVLDGRDIGTVVCPEADVKIFMTADLEVRATRRFIDLKKRGYSTLWHEVFDDMKIRDDRDKNRAVAPLKPAQDAVVLDTTRMTEEEVLRKTLDIICNKAY